MMETTSTAPSPQSAEAPAGAPGARGGKRPADRPVHIAQLVQRYSAEPGQCDVHGAFERVIVAGHVAPEHCPACVPPELRSLGTPAPGQGAGVLDVEATLAAGGVNMHKYRDATLESFDPAEDPHALEAALAYLDVWRARRGERFGYHPWCYFYGTGSRLQEQGNRKEVSIGKTSNGKTHLTIAIARALIAERLISPDRFLFAEMEEVLMRSEAAIRGAEDSEERLVEHYARPDLLILDDAFVRPPTNHSMRLLLRILNRRAGRGLLVSSNIDLPTAKAWHDGMRRIVTRIVDDCGDGGQFLIPFRGSDRRARRLSRTTT